MELMIKDRMKKEEITKTQESTLSKIPPCPLIKLEKSFILLTLLNQLNKRSPITEMVDKTKIRPTDNIHQPKLFGAIPLFLSEYLSHWFPKKLDCRL
jgi:hypothetical protein